MRRFLTSIRALIKWILSGFVSLTAQHVAENNVTPQSLSQTARRIGSIMQEDTIFQGILKALATVNQNSLPSSSTPS